MDISKNFTKIIPGEIDSETKFSKKLSLRTLIEMLVVIIVTQNFSDYIHPNLQLMYTIFCFVLALFLVFPSKSNPEKKMYHCIYLSLIKKRKTYRAIDREEALEFEQN